MARKNQAKRGNGNGGMPAWLWALIGLALGLVIAAYFFLGDYWKNRNTNEPTPNPAAEAPVSHSEDAVAQEPTEKPKPKYDFYTLLPEKEVVIPDAELQAQAEAEAKKNAAPVNPATPDLVTATPEALPATESRFLIQAGAFKNQDEAENLKATIALTGEVARIESAEINGTTVYRVRLGPYNTASSLSSAKQALSSHGIEAQAIKVK
ncbi:MAG: SPOR domain-containing protein [Methylococcales bacterium]